MGKQKRDGRLSAADETEAMVLEDKAADDELSDDTSGYRQLAGKKPDEGAGPDGRVHIFGCGFVLPRRLRVCHAARR